MQQLSANQEIEITKSSGDKAVFSAEKLRNSLRRSGADDPLVTSIVQTVSKELYDGISTNEIYKRDFALLKKKRAAFAYKYKLKKAIYELGPTGFPFEKFISAILRFSGYHTETNTKLQGNCVSHEIDVVASRKGAKTLIECKFHSKQGHKCNVRIPLYIDARFRDINGYRGDKKSAKKHPDRGWVVTNTRFTEDALSYGRCVGLYLLSWDHPQQNALKDRIDSLGLYPITVSTVLNKREKQFLLSRDIVLCKQLEDDSFYLDHLGLSRDRKRKVLEEIQQLCSL